MKLKNVLSLHYQVSKAVKKMVVENDISIIMV